MTDQNGEQKAPHFSAALIGALVAFLFWGPWSMFPGAAIGLFAEAVVWWLRRPKDDGR